MDREKKYQIGNTIYVQRPVVLGQLAQLIKVIPDSADITEITGPNDVITFLGDALAEAMAIVLWPRGVSSLDKDLDSIKAELTLAMDLPTAMEVIEDFFGFNQVSSLVGRVGNLMTMMENPNLVSGSKNGSVSSRRETSPNGS